MQPHHYKQVSIGLGLCLAFALGVMLQSLMPFARPTEAQGIVVDGHVTVAEPAAPAALPNDNAYLTYQGRLTNSSGTSINSAIAVTFRIYTETPSIAIWTSAARTITPTNGLFTVYLGGGADPELWTGVLVQAAFIGVTVGGDAEMTPRQALNTVVGHSDTDAGVYGTSTSGYGVYGGSSSSDGVVGFSNTGLGVYGGSNNNSGVSGSSITGRGVYAESTSGDGMIGRTYSLSSAGVVAYGEGPSGIALRIENGGIKATGAIITGGDTFAFVHESVSGVGGNIVGNTTIITNSLTDGDRNAMLFVTHVNNPTGFNGNNDFNFSFGVVYLNDGHWAIYREDGGNFPVNITFNVMVIKR